jgi:TRAP-type C4-dicarboxylate transport system permease small subunit
MKEEKINFQKFLSKFEIYIATICFFILTFFLTGQVVSRYLLQHSFTWMEELATIMFVWMNYMGVSGAVTNRKHLRIDFFLEMMSFKVKRFFLILSNVIFAGFNIYIFFVMLNLIKMLGRSVTTMLRIPKASVYIIIPIGLLLTVVRLIQDTIKLSRESESELGTSKPSIDLDQCEREYQQRIAMEKKEVEA